MGTEKGGPKSRGFSHLFDWNRKSRKKLFSVSPENTKQENENDDSLPGAKFPLLDEDETVGISSMKDSSEYSCASSVTDEGGNGTRVPGLVARLMGLSSMPAPGISEPYSSPWHDNKFPGDKQSHRRGPEFFINDKINPARNEANIRKLAELRTQKMPSSPIERFQTETLPLRSAKAVSLPHYKLLSPIKIPGFTPPRNTAHIMEQAANIAPVLPFNSRVRASSSYGLLKVREPKNTTAASQRTSRVLESCRRPAEPSETRYLKGQSLNKSWNGSDDSSVTFRSSPDISYSNSLDGKSKGNSVSLAIQAKVNVQRRERLSLNSRNASLVIKDVDEGKLNRRLENQPINQNNKQKKKVSVSGGSDILRQNNQLQNCLSDKAKLTKKSVTNKQGRKIIYRDNTSVKKNTTKPSGSSKNGKSCHKLETSTTESEGFLSNKDYPQKKRLIEGDFNCRRNSFSDNVQVVRHQKHVHSNVLIDEQVRWSEEKSEGSADVVSFTFTSPLVKSTPTLPSSNLVEKNCEKRNNYEFDRQFQKNSFTAKKPSPQGLNPISGDALSLLLEQKLRELTSADDSSYCNFEAASSTSFTPVQQALDVGSANTSTSVHKKAFLPKGCSNQQSLTFGTGMPSTDGCIFGLSYKSQGLEGEYSSNADAGNEPNLLQPSPLSILDISFSSESCNSSASTASTIGSKTSLHSSQTKNISSSCAKNKLSSFEADFDLLDSASSSSSVGAASVSSERRRDLARKQDLDYVREIINSRMASSGESPLRSPSFLFQKLEKNRGRDGRTSRKMMFDCVNELLGDRNDRLFKSGYRGWANEEAMVLKDMAEEVFEEMSRWKSSGDCMVDELVDRDMSSRRGRWVDFKMEAFELGEEMEKEIIASFIDEVLKDCFQVYV